MDGTTVNLSAMKLFGCTFGSFEDANDGSFCYSAFNHMLKLARNALGDLKIFIDSEGDRVEWKCIQLLHEEQSKIGLKFANSLSIRHVEYRRSKMNVKIASQTLSSSAADALQYLLVSGHPSFTDCDGTIKFIRVVDRLFDLLNSRNPFGSAFKTPLRLANQEVWESVIKSSLIYFLGLRCLDGTPLAEHRRKTFITGFILSAKSVEKLAMDLFKEGYNYFLTYKVSQDHVELLFACIRGNNGFNNNPDVRVFKAALKRLLIRNSIVASKNANCAMLEENDFNPVFSLKWSKNRAPLQESIEVDDENETDISLYISQLSAQSPYQY